MLTFKVGFSFSTITDSFYSVSCAVLAPIRYSIIIIIILIPLGTQFPWVNKLLANCYTKFNSLGVLRKACGVVIGVAERI